jgi:adenine deaminase
MFKHFKDLSDKENSFLISGNIVDPLNNRIYSGTISIEDGVIINIMEDKKKYDNYILPGFIDAHIHIESSLMLPTQFAQIAITHGTIAVVCDPHEIANVMGVPGVEFMIENSKKSKMKFHFAAPSCIPASPYEDSGIKIDSHDIDYLLQKDEIYNLGEMMNFPGVINRDPEVMKKIELAQEYGKPIDGHAPGLTGELLDKYIETGITSDHESIEFDEGHEKILKGLKLIIRDGSAARNFYTLSHLINQYPNRCMFGTDDLHPDDLIMGHLDVMVRNAIELEIDILKILYSACVVPVKHYGLNVGLLQDGDPADFIVVSDLDELSISATYIDGILVSEDGHSLLEQVKEQPLNRFECNPIMERDIAVEKQTDQIRVINFIEGQVLTKQSIFNVSSQGDFIYSDIEKDILKVVLVSRYDASKKPVVAFARNFGLKHGAMASSVSHDAHNIIAIGVSDRDICLAINQIIKHKGGLAISDNGVIRILPLPYAGLMADGEAEDIAEQYLYIQKSAKELGCTLEAPFMALSFLGLTVIPEIKLCKDGLLNVNSSKIIPLFI